MASIDPAPPCPTAADRKRTVLLLALASIAIAALAEIHPLALGETWVERDQLTYTLPSRAVLREALRQGRLPEWCDGFGLGAAFAANLSHGVMYPPAWMVAVVPMPFASDLLLIVHVAWMALGASLFARRLGASTRGAAVAGAALVTSGYVASVIVNGIPILTLAWTPWVLLAADRLAHSDGQRARLIDAAIFSALFAAQTLSGDPAGLVSSAMACTALVAVRAPRRLPSLLVLAAAFAAALPLAAVGLAPELSLLAESQRAGGLTIAAATTWSLHPLRLLEFVWPQLLGDPADATANIAGLVADTAHRTAGLAPSWTASEYVSLPIIFLAAVGGARRGARGLLVIALAFVLLALGDFTPLYSLVRALSPVERFLRYPEKYLAAALVLCSALAGAGFTRAFEETPSRRRVMIAIALTLLLGGAVFVTLSFGIHNTSEVSNSIDLDRARAAAIEGGETAIVVALLFAGALALAHHPRLGRFAGPLAALVLLAHLAGESWLVQPLADRAEVARAPSILSTILDEGARADGVHPRLYRPPELMPVTDVEGPAARRIALRDLALENSAIAWGFSHAPGYDPTLPSRLKLLWDLTGRPGAGRKIVDLLDIEYVLLPVAAASPPGFTAIATQSGATLFRNQGHRPRAFVASRWRFVPDDEAARNCLLDGASPRGEICVIGSGAPPSPSSGAIETACTVRFLHPEEVELDCASDSGGYAVLLDSFAPGWTATVDGKPTPIVRAEAVAKAVPIPPGNHQIRYRYRTPGLRPGALISLAAWLALIGFFLKSRSDKLKNHSGN